jgi:hypothetical protein
MNAIRNIVTEDNKRDQFNKIALSCVHDMQRNYGDACETGKALSALLKKNLWYDDVDV